MAQPLWQSNQWSARNQSDTAWTNYSLQAAPATGLKLYITDIWVDCGATSRTFKLLDGSGGTVLWQATLAINGSCSHRLTTPIPLTAATALCLTSSGASVGAFVAVNGFISR